MHGQLRTLAFKFNEPNKNNLGHFSVLILIDTELDPYIPDSSDILYRADDRKSHYAFNKVKKREKKSATVREAPFTGFNCFKQIPINVKHGSRTDYR